MPKDQTIAMLVLAAALVLFAHSANAQARTPGLPEFSSAALESLIEKATAGKGRVEIKVGELDPRLQLAPCDRAEPTVLPGTRLWGKSHITIRCVSGAQWSVLLPITVSVFGNALVARRNLTKGAILHPGDFELEAIDLTKDNATWVSDSAQVHGRTLSRPMVLGQALRSDYLVTAPTMQQGDTVKVLLSGDGFVIASEASAMGNAGPGQPLRLRTESGKVISGTVRDGYVEVRP